MDDINPEGKYDEDVNNGVDENNTEKLSNQSIRTPMGEPVTKSFGDTAFENILDKDPGKDKVRCTGNKCGCWEGERGVSNSMYGAFKKASRVINAANMAEIMSALEAGDEGHEVRNILEQLLELGMEEVELHRVPGGKQVADFLTTDISSNQVEKGKFLVEQSDPPLSET